jgi:hypothetical protein
MSSSGGLVGRWGACIALPNRLILARAGCFCPLASHARDLMPPSDETDLSRRSVLKAGAGGAIGGLLVAGAWSEAGGEPSAAKRRNVYDVLGVKRIINAAGTFTALGGSLMPPEVVEAWIEASKHFVDLLELQDRVGERIAKLLGVEAALVTTGAAGGMVLGTAAALTYRDRGLISRLPLPPEMGQEVIRQKSHHDCYDQQITTCGVRLVDVETLEELERAINSRTAMMMAYNFLEPTGKIRHAEWIGSPADVACRRCSMPPPTRHRWRRSRNTTSSASTSWSSAAARASAAHKTPGCC